MFSFDILFLSFDSAVLQLFILSFLSVGCLINFIFGVERTYQEHEIFTKIEIKKKLASVLYIYAKENPEYGYKQGMNDILGVFLYVLHKNYFYGEDFYGDDMSCVYSIFHSNNYFIEHDLFLVFIIFNISYNIRFFHFFHFT